MMTPPNRARRWAWIALQIVLLIAVGIGAYRALRPGLASLTMDELLAWEPSRAGVAVSLAILVGVYVAHALLWRRILRDLGFGDLSTRDTVRIYFTASLGRYLPGKLWQLAGLAVLAGRVGVPTAGAAAAAVLGQISFLGTGLLFLAVLLPRWLEGSGGLIVAGILIVSTCTAWFVIASPIGRSFRTWILGKTSGRVQERLTEAFEAAQLVRLSTAFAWLAGYGATWIALGIAFSMLVSAFVPEVQPESRHLAGVVAASYIWGYAIVVAPAGLGARELFMSGLLAQVPGMTPAGAVAIPIISRLWFTIAELLPFLSLPFLSTSVSARARRPAPKPGPGGRGTP